MSLPPEIKVEGEWEIKVATLPVRVALMLIAHHGCERLTTGTFACHFETAWSPYAQFSDDRWCDACIAKAALNRLDAEEIARRRKA